MTPTSYVQTLENIHLSKKQLNKLQKLINININQKLNAKDKLQKSLELLLNQISASQGSIILLDDKLEYYKIVASSQKDLLNLQKNVNPKSIIGHVCQNNKPIFIKNINKEKPSSPTEKKHKYQSVIAYPIISNDGKLIGIFNATNYIGDSLFNESDFKLAATFLLILTPIVENYISLKELSSEIQENKDILSEILTGRKAQKYSTDIEEVMEYYREQEDKTEPDTLSEITSGSNYFNKQQAKKHKIGKKKSTYYLDHDLVENLENAKKYIKKEVPKNMKSMVTKSKIINFALDTILRDYKAKNKNSMLMKALLSDDKY